MLVNDITFQLDFGLGSHCTCWLALHVFFVSMNQNLLNLFHQSIIHSVTFTLSKLTAILPNATYSTDFTKA